MLHNNVGYIDSGNNSFGKNGHIILRLIGVTGKLAKPVLILQGCGCAPIVNLQNLDFDIRL